MCQRVPTRQNGTICNDDVGNFTDTISNDDVGNFTDTISDAVTYIATPSPTTLPSTSPSD